METVSTIPELERALSEGETHLLLKGDLARAINKKKSRRKVAKIVGAAFVAGGVLTAIPTAGASLGATAIGLTIGTFTITAIELAIIFGGSAVILAILKGRGVNLKRVDSKGNVWEMNVAEKS